MKNDSIPDKNLTWWQKFLMNHFLVLFSSVVIFMVSFYFVCSYPSDNLQLYATLMLCVFLFICPIVPFILQKLFYKDVTERGLVIIKVDSGNKVVAVGPKQWIRKGEKCYLFDLNSFDYVERVEGSTCLYIEDRSFKLMIDVSVGHFMNANDIDWQELADYIKEKIGVQSYKKMSEELFAADFAEFEKNAEKVFVKYVACFPDNIKLKELKKEIESCFTFRKLPLNKVEKVEVTYIVKVGI